MKNRNGFTLLPLFLFLLSLVKESQAHSSNQYSGRFANAATDASNKLRAISNRFSVDKHRYETDRKSIIMEKRNDLKQMEDQTKHFSNHFAQKSCKNASNKRDCIKRKNREFNKIIFEYVKRTAQTLRRRTIQLAKNYIIIAKELRRLIDTERSKIKNELRTIQQLRKEKKYGGSKAFSKEYNDLNNVVDRMDVSRKLIMSFIDKLKSIVLQNMCFELTGATGILNTPAERKKFEELTSEAMALSAADRSFDADVLGFIVVKQRRPVARALRVATVLAINCNCADDDPRSDVWSKRRLEEEEGTMEIASNNKNRFEIDMHELAQEQDEIELKSNSRIDKSQKGTRELPFLTLPSQYNDEDDVLDDTRELISSELKRRYLASLKHVFSGGDLSGVEDVKQISCDEFDMVDPWRYIKSFKLSFDA